MSDETFLGPDNVEHGMVVRFRTMRSDGTGTPTWTAWTPGRLHVQKREGQHADKYGAIAVLALQGYSWAEYDHQDFDRTSGTWLTEDYYLQLRRA